MTAGLDALAAGKPPTVTYVERLTQLILHAHGEPLKPASMESNVMPADDDNGLWNPAFKALGMKTIAKGCGEPSFKFLRKPEGYGWPILTIVEPAALALWKQELATPWRKKLATLPNSTFDPKRRPMTPRTRISAATRSRPASQCSRSGRRPSSSRAP